MSDFQRFTAGAFLRSLLFFAFAAVFIASAPKAEAFAFEDVAARAQALAGSAYRPTQSDIPAELKQLTYDGYRDVRFRPDRALWRKERLPFEVMFFHMGGYFTQPVAINEITPQGVKHIAFKAEDFHYGKNKLSPTGWGDVGFAGFRVHYPLHGKNYKDEVVVFLGASYFRALGQHQRYGLSARGLAIDTVGGQGEEFPRFVEFWLQRPTRQSNSLTIYALLDSPRATGAYRFELKPGKDTVANVQARLFLRSGVTTLGVAPLTSMFQFGENQPLSGEFRPEVHDSDGLSIAAGNGEWIWRPLINPSKPLATSFALNSVKGFGLMQRDGNFGHYEDLEARYEKRPSAWVEPLGDWGPGRVELLQLPTPDETHDNIVAYWVPQKPLVPGEPLDFAYRLYWQASPGRRPPHAWTAQSRRGRGYAALQKDEVQYVIDFEGPALAKLPADADVEPMVSSNAAARVVESNAYRNEVTGGWRLTLRIKRVEPTQPVELRAFLQRNKQVLTETWSTILPSD